jgi:hypothetical protein
MILHNVFPDGNHLIEKGRNDKNESSPDNFLNNYNFDSWAE